MSFLFQNIKKLGYLYLIFFVISCKGPEELDLTNIENEVPIYHYKLQNGIQFVSGFIAGITSSIITNPFDILRTNIQIQNNISEFIIGKNVGTSGKMIYDLSGNRR